MMQPSKFNNSKMGHAFLSSVCLALILIGTSAGSLFHLLRAAAKEKDEINMRSIPNKKEGGGGGGRGTKLS